MNLVPTLQKRDTHCALLGDVRTEIQLQNQNAGDCATFPSTFAKTYNEVVHVHIAKFQCRPRPIYVQRVSDFHPGDQSRCTPMILYTTTVP